MNGLDILILLVVVLCVVSALVSICRQKKKGNGCCGNCKGGCTGCPHNT